MPYALSPDDDFSLLISCCSQSSGLQRRGVAAWAWRLVDRGFSACHPPLKAFPQRPRSTLPTIPETRVYIQDTETGDVPELVNEDPGMDNVPELVNQDTESDDVPELVNQDLETDDIPELVNEEDGVIEP